MTGPRWFQVLSIGLGPAVVVGSMLVHTEGVDFTALEPAVLGVALFLAIPGVYAALLTVVAERWLDRDAWFLSGRLWLTALPLLLWAPIAPLLGALTVVFGVLAAVRRTRRGAALLGHPASPWLARGALAVVFFLGVADLARDVATLT